MVSSKIDTIDQDNQFEDEKLVAKVFKPKIVYSNMIFKLPSIPLELLSGTIKQLPMVGELKKNQHGNINS